MKIYKRVNLGEYIVDIEYDDVTGSLDLSVLDELEGVIESISVSNYEENDEENDNDNDNDIDQKLN